MKANKAEGPRKIKRLEPKAALQKVRAQPTFFFSPSLRAIDSIIFLVCMLIFAD